MRSVNSEIHKALLPYKAKPILWYIVSSIPETLKLGFLLGHNATQIRDFLQISFPDRDFSFIYVDDWTSEKSGTGYSLLAAKELTEESFWYLPCDGIINDIIFDSPFESEFDQIYVQETIGHEASNYTWFPISITEKRVKKFKESTKDEKVLAFTGVMRIKSALKFFSRLEASKSKEFIPAISETSELVEIFSWQDFGSPEKYNSALDLSGDFNFSKSNEITYELPTTIVKWWSDTKVPIQKLSKPKASPEIFPPGVSILGSFLYYKRVPGASFYEEVSPALFSNLLDYLGDKLWIRSDTKISKDAKDFYESKSNERLTKMLAQGLGNLAGVTNINGLSVSPWEDHWQTFDFKVIVENVFTSRIHGDLQFDNIIYDSELNSFCLIDWRPNFGAQEILGDIYYDFAKLLGGIRLDYSQIKKNNFDFSITDTDKVIFKIPSAPNSKELEQVLERYVESNGYDFSRVKSLVPLIYLNMAPLHEPPFREILWSLFLVGSRDS
jgi:choline kinase